MIKLPNVQRHSVDGYGRQDICYNDPEGEFVYYEDYCALRQELDSLRAEVQRLNSTAQPVSDGWVKPGISKPNPNQQVYCHGQYGDDDIDGEEYGFKGYMDEKGRWYAINNGDYCDGGYGHDYRARVSAWMPLPAAPGGQDD